jgi:hypothetical protein
MQLLSASLAVLVAAGYLGVAIGFARYPSALSAPWAVGDVHARPSAISALVRLGILTAVATLVAWPYFQGGTATSPGWQGVKWTGSLPQSGVNITLDLRWFLIGLAALAVVTVGFLVRRFAPRRRAHGGRQAVKASPVTEGAVLTDVTDEALMAIMGDPNARRAVLACYARMEIALAKVGLPRAPEETSIEYAHRLLLGTGPAREAVESLTSLFHVAGFSSKRIDEAMRDKAIASLRTIRGAAS